MFQWFANVKNLLWDWLIYPLMAGGSRDEEINDPGDSGTSDGSASDVPSDKS